MLTGPTITEPKVRVGDVMPTLIMRTKISLGGVALATFER